MISELMAFLCVHLAVANFRMSLEVARVRCSNAATPMGTPTPAREAMLQHTQGFRSHTRALADCAYHIQGACMLHVHSVTIAETGWAAIESAKHHIQWSLFIDDTD